MEKKNKPKKILTKQKVMRRVILATIPCILSSIYFFGWRSAVVVLISTAVAFLTEFIFLVATRRKEPVSEAVFVSGILYALILPPTVPWHVVVIGIAFAILFGKMVFGGFGRNIFNPAMVGRAFVYISFPVAMTAKWAPAASFPLGALGQWSTAAPDVITSASPMGLLKQGLGDAPRLLDLLIGNVAGSMGVTSVIAILIGGVYLFASGTANRWIILITVGVYALINLIADVAGMPNASGPLVALMGGGFLFGAFFMATDPVSAPKTLCAQLIYGGLIALFTFVIRNFSVFNGGMMFSILLANMFAPILDYSFKQAKKKRKEKVVRTAKESA